MDLQPLDKEYEERMVQFRLDCDDGKGNAAACHSVGEYLSVVKRDDAAAAKIYSENCKSRNHAGSCFNFGRQLLTGRGVQQNDKLALQAFEKGCDGEHPHACHHLGMMLLRGTEDECDTGVPADTQRAVGIMREACKQGSSDSCHHLSSLLLKGGLGVAKDAPGARSLMEIGCDQGYAPCCYNLAVMFKKGDEGVPPDQDKFDEYSERVKGLLAAGASLSATRAI